MNLLTIAANHPTFLLIGFGAIAVLCLLLSWTVWKVLIKFPIAAIIHCLQSQLSWKAKCLWLPVLVGGWTLGAIVYAFFRDPGRDLRPAAYFSLVWFGLVGVVVAVLFFGISSVTSTVSKTVLFNMDYDQSHDLSADERKAFKSHVQTLNREIGRTALLMRLYPEPYKIRMALLGLALLDTTDSHFSRAEYEEWNQYYQKRSKLTLEERQRLNKKIDDWRNSSK